MVGKNVTFEEEEEDGGAEISRPLNVQASVSDAFRGEGGGTWGPGSEQELGGGGGGTGVERGATVYGSTIQHSDHATHSQGVTAFVSACVFPWLQ